ncbi:hypothetical protein G6F51_014510 [Rhizopus arrhizus]|uniref:Uncharacterized protein n=1 Tax=Rhizopus oryzae TaxID=64495 RepID=A0A9P6XM76_RHIOR|nr:hypothetical protein G6F51_014510 [Rhizopus arrhizus]
MPTRFRLLPNASISNSILDRLPSEASVALMSPFSIDELIQTSARCPTASSPGIDDLPYEVLSLIFRT